MRLIQFSVDCKLAVETDFVDVGNAVMNGSDSLEGLFEFKEFEAFEKGSTRGSEILRAQITERLVWEGVESTDSEREWTLYVVESCPFVGGREADFW